VPSETRETGFNGTVGSIAMALTATGAAQTASRTVKVATGMIGGSLGRCPPRRWPGIAKLPNGA
jgi:hypothetical protein